MYLIGKRVSCRDMTRCWRVVTSGVTDLMLLLYENISGYYFKQSHVSSQELNVCLHWAAYAGSVDIAELVLNSGCSLASVNMHGDTPLHIAAREGYLECVTWVINNLRTRLMLESLPVSRASTLSISSDWIVSVCCSLFLSRGADIDIMNREGDTPLTLARVDTPVWVALQINRKLRRGITNRMLRTERIICRYVCDVLRWTCSLFLLLIGLI